MNVLAEVRVRPATPVWRLGMPIPDDWTPVASLVHAVAVENPRQGDIAEIALSIRHNGFFGRLLVQAHSAKQGGPRILIGNHRFQAGCSLSMDAFPADWIDCTDAEGDKILIADNRYSDLAGWSDQRLADMLTALDDLDGTGFDEDAFEALLAEIDLEGEPEEPGERGGRAVTSDSLIQVGTIQGKVSRERWDAYEAQLTAEVGIRHEDLFAEICARLGI